MNNINGQKKLLVEETEFITPLPTEEMVLKNARILLFSGKKLSIAKPIVSRSGWLTEDNHLIYQGTKVKGLFLYQIAPKCTTT